MLINAWQGYIVLPVHLQNAGGDHHVAAAAKLDVTSSRYIRSEIYAFILY